MVDKPGRRKKNKFPWGKVVAVVIAIVVVGAAGWYVYENYVYAPPPVYAKLGTSDGYIYAELYPACAPNTVTNFKSLANSGFYNDLVWHRIMPGFVIQTGDNNTRGGLTSTRSTWGSGGSNTSVPFEWCGWLHNYAGYIGMASTAAKGPSTSQFYIILTNSTSNLSLDGSYTVFGKVISGMNAVCDLANNKTDPVYPSSASPSYLSTQPIYPAKAMLYNVTMISQSQAPVPQKITQCG